MKTWKNHKKTRVVLLFILCASLTLPAGCHDYREISDVTFIAGAGVDLDPAGGYLLTLETVDFASAEGGTSPKPALITTAAPTLSLAVEDAERHVSSRLYWNHAAVVVVGKALAEQGMGAVTDFILANLDTAMNVWLMVAGSDTAQEIFSLKTHGSPIVSYVLTDIMQDNPYFGQTIPQRLYEILPELEGESSTTLLATVCGVPQNEEDMLTVSGSAVMHGGRLRATLDGEQTAAALILRNTLSRKTLSVETGERPLSVELLGVTRRLSALSEDPSPTLDIAVDAGFALTEGRAADFAELGARVGERLTGQLTEIIELARQEIGCDLFGFGEYLHRYDPALYGQMLAAHGDWNAAFRSLDCRIDVRARAVRGSTGPAGST